MGCGFGFWLGFGGGGGGGGGEKERSEKSMDPDLVDLIVVEALILEYPFIFLLSLDCSMF